MIQLTLGVEFQVRKADGTKLKQFSLDHAYKLFGVMIMNEQTKMAFVDDYGIMQWIDHYNCQVANANEFRRPLAERDTTSADIPSGIQYNWDEHPAIDRQLDSNAKPSGHSAGASTGAAEQPKGKRARITLEPME